MSIPIPEPGTVEHPDREHVKSIGHEARQLLVIAFPTILAQLATMATNVVDVMMSGRLSSDALAAVSVGSNLFTPILVFALGIFLALNPIVAHLNGRNERTAIVENLRQGLWLSLFLALPAMLALRQLSALAHPLGIAPAVIPDVDAYLKALSWGQFPLFGFFALRFFNEGLFNTKPVMYVQFLAVPCNALLNYLLMYGKLGLPALGTEGLGYATSIVWSLSFVALLAYTARTRRFTDLELFGWVRPHGERLWEILKVGLPIAVSLGMEILLFAIIGLLIGRIGVATVAGHQIAINLASLTFMVPMGLSMAITSRVGYYAGQGSARGIRRAGLVGIILSGGFMWLSATLFITLPEVLVGFYTRDPAVIKVASFLLFFAAIFQLSDGFQVSGQGALRGLKDTQVPMLTNTVAYWVIGFPAGYWLANEAGMSAPGYWMGLVLGLTAAAVFHNVRFWWLSRKWQSPRDTEHADGETTPAA